MIEPLEYEAEQIFSQHLLTQPNDPLSAPLYPCAWPNISPRNGKNLAQPSMGEPRYTARLCMLAGKAPWGVLRDTF